MKRNLLLLLTVIVLGGIAYFLSKKETDKKANKTYDFSYRDFAVKDIEKVHKIVLVNRNTGVLTFDKKDKRWLINKKHVVSKNTMNNMLTVIKNVKIDYVPTDAAVKNIMKNMMLDGIKVELYDEKGNTLKKYHVGGSPENSTGTYFVMDGFAKPLVMTIPGFKGNLKVRFSYELDDWRDKTVINENIDAIKEISMKYVFDEKSSFVISKDGNDYKVNTVYPSQKSMNGLVDQNYVKSYLLGYESKFAEGFENYKEKKSDIISRKPIVEISITRNNGTVKNLKLYMNPKSDELIEEREKVLNKYLNDMVLRYFMLDDNNDLYLIQYEVFKDLFIPYKKFFK